MTGVAMGPSHADGSTAQPAPTKTASTQFIFDPPAGWQHVGALGGGLGTWLHSGDAVYSQNVSAQATTFNGKLADIVTKEIAYVQEEFAGVTMKPIEQTTVCGKHAATYFAYTFDAKNTQVVAEQIVTIYGSTAYTAKYNRAVDQQPDASAEQSLRSLCGGDPPSSPANAAQASVQDRRRMSVTVSDDIHDREPGKANPFKSDAVELGATVIEGPYGHFALADWRSADGKVHGQVFFFYGCDHWNVGTVSIGRPIREQDLVARWSTMMPAKTAQKLVADLAELQDRVAYLKPAPAGPTC